MINSKKLVLYAMHLNDSKSHSENDSTGLLKVIRTVNQDLSTALLTPLNIIGDLELAGICIDPGSGVSVIFALEEAIASAGLKLKMNYALSFGEIGAFDSVKESASISGPALAKAKEIVLLDRKKGRFHAILGEDAKNKALKNGFTVFQEIVDAWDSNPELEQVSTFFNPSSSLLTESEGIKKAKNAVRFRMREYFAIKTMIGFLAE